MGTIKRTQQEIKKIFDDFEQKKVMIIGDVMVDSYWWGKVSRISPEAPVPIVLVKNREYRLGGAANVALNIKQLGATPVLCSFTGDDFEGSTFHELLNKRDIDSSAILTSRQRPTTLKSRIIANEQQQVVRLDTETDAYISTNERKQLKTKITDVIDSCDAIIFQDYDKGVISKSLIKDITEMAVQRGIPTIVDPKKRNFGYYKNTSLFKPNLKELREGLSLPIDKPVQIEQLRKAAETLFEKMNIGAAFITLSEEGVYINYRKSDYLVSSHKRSIFDVSGAGDTVAAVAALAMASELDAQLLAELTNISGGLVCERVGVVPIEREWMEKECVKLLA